MTQQELKIKISAETSKFDSSIKNVNKSLNEVKKAGEAVDKALNKQKGKAFDSVNEKIKRQTRTLNELKNKYAEYTLAGKNTEKIAKGIENLSKELQDNKTKWEEAKTKADGFDKMLSKIEDKQLKEVENTTEETKEELKEATTEARTFGEVFKGSFIGTLLGNIASQALDKITSGIKDATRAIIGGSLEGYASYEQLTGGVQKIFGDDAQAVIKNAEKAYKTAGLDANTYMEQVTSFSASLIQSLDGDTEKATKDADLAIRDMSDNANTYGTEIESIQNAYQGFAKGNFTMLDNLRLGYGGTQKEMARLLEDAEKLTGIHYDIDNYDDIINAIHAIQNEQHITGTTAKEASKTIEGSVNSMKGAWQNWLVGLGSDNANMKKLTKNLVKSLSNVAKNVIPRLGKIISTLIEGMPEIVDTIKKQVEKVAPQIWESLKKSVPKGWADTLENIKNVFSTVGDIVKKHGATIAKGIGAVVVAIQGMKVVKPVISTISGIKGAISGLLGSEGGGEGGEGGGIGFKDSIKNTLKGIANIALIIGAITALIVAYSALSKIPGFSDFMGSGIKQLQQILKGITSMCSIQMAGFVAGIEILGTVGIQTTLSGLASLASILAGVSALVLAFGALSKMEGFKKFINSGIKMLSDLFDGLGQIVGSLVKGFTETAFDGLEEVGTHLSEFAKASSPFFKKVNEMSGVDLSGFIDALDTLVKADTTNKVQKLQGMGEMDLGGIGTQLSAFADNVKPFFKKMAGIDDGAIEGGKKALSILESLDGLDIRSGGVKEFFVGKKDLAGLGEQLSAFADSIKPFFNKMAKISDDGIKKGKKVIIELGSSYFSKLTNLSGTTFGSLGVALEALAPSVVKFYGAMARVNDDGLDKGKRAIIELGSSYFAKLSEQTGTNYENFGNHLALLAPSVVKFYNAMAGLNEDGLDKGKKAIIELGSSYFTRLSEVASGADFGTFGEQLGNLAPGIKKFYNKMANINTDVDIPAIIKPITSLIKKIREKAKGLHSAIKSLNNTGKTRLNSLTRTFSKAQSSINKSLSKIQKDTETTKTKMANAFTKMSSTITNKASAINKSVSSKFKSMADSATRAINRINNLSLHDKTATATLKVKYTTASPVFNKKKSADGKSEAYGITYNTHSYWAKQGAITKGLNILGFGEAGREAILPLDNNTGWMDKLAERITPNVVVEGGGGSYPDASINVNVSLGGADLGYALIDSINEAMDESGQVLLAI